jgi:Ca2+-binding EF-hand superfamily protein
MTHLFLEEIAMLHTLSHVRGHLMTSMGIDIPTLIKIFDPTPKGFVTRDNFLDGIAVHLDLTPTPRQEELFVRRYFKNSITTKDLLYILFGIRKNEAEYYLQMMRARYGPSQATENNQMFIGQLTHLIRVLFECEERSDEVRKKLFSEPYSDLFEAFCIIDSKKDGVITIDEVQRFMPNLSEEEIEYLFYRLDKNRDGRIGYIDFILEATPIYAF